MYRGRLAYLGLVLAIVGGVLIAKASYLGGAVCVFFAVLAGVGIDRAE